MNVKMLLHPVKFDVKKIILPAVAVIICVLIMAYFCFGNIHDVGDTVSYRSGPSTGIIPSILDGQTVQQVFVPTTEIIYEISVQFGTYMRENHFTLKMELSELSSGEILATSAIDASTLADNSYEKIELDWIPVKSGEPYVVTFTTEGATEENTVAFYRTADGKADKDNSEPTDYAIIDGVKTNFSLDMLVRGRGIAKEDLNSIHVFSAVIFLASVAFIIFGFILIYKLTHKIEMVFLTLAIGLGLFYMILITPNSVPDESYHYQSAYKLSNVLLFRWDKLDYGEPSHFDYSGIELHHNILSAYIRIIKDFNSPHVRGAEEIIPERKRIQYPMHHLPQAVGIAISRLTNRNFVQTYLLGRLFNLIYYSLCLYFAVKRMPKFKVMLGLIGIMPMALHQAASYSYDSFINGMSFLLIASILKAIYEDGLLSRRDFCWILVVGALLAPAKIIYFSITLLALLIPEHRFGGKKKKIIGLAIIWASGIVVIAGFRLSAVLLMVGKSVGAIEGLGSEGGHTYTWLFVFKHPLQTVMIFAGTFINSAWSWIREAVGQLLSGRGLSLPIWIIDGYMLIILISASSQAESTDIVEPKVRSRFCQVSLLVIFLAMLALFLDYTSDFRTVIDGIQGRYFIPVIPLLVMSTNNQILVLRRNMDKALISSAVLLQCSSFSYILDYTLQQ